MKIFILQRIANVSDHWHPEGGVVIIAENKEQAEDILYAGEKTANITAEEWTTAEIYELVGNPAPKYWIMVDAGCC